MSNVKTTIGEKATVNSATTGIQGGSIRQRN